MPTGEFISLGHEFGQINDLIEDAEEQLASARKRREEFMNEHGLPHGAGPQTSGTD
jgi:hypothetical protein